MGGRGSTRGARRRPASGSIELPELAELAPMDVAERFRDLSGLVLLESARPGRNARWTYLTADPVAILEAPRRAGTPSPAPGACSAGWRRTA